MKDSSVRNEIAHLRERVKASIGDTPPPSPVFGTTVDTRRKMDRMLEMHYGWPEEDADDDEADRKMTERECREYFDRRNQLRKSRDRKKDEDK